MDAAELMAQLENDPEYQAMMRAQEAEAEESLRALARAEAPILADLRAAGLEVDSVWDLTADLAPYPAALPILIDHLDRGGYPAQVTESLGQALGKDKNSLAFWDRLKNRWLNARNLAEENAAAIALTEIATKEQLDDLIELLSNEALGDARIFLIRPILKLGRDRGWGIIEPLRDHPVLGTEVTARLKARRGRKRK